MTYVFWARRYSDVDHIVPIIYALLRCGIKSDDIIYTDLWGDNTLLTINQDPRIQFLNNYGVSYNQPFRKLRVLLFNEYITAVVKNRFLSSTLGALWYKLGQWIIAVLFEKYLVKISSQYRNSAVFITDHGTSKPYRILAQNAQANKIPVVAMPHGLILHLGARDEATHNVIKPDDKALTIFDHVVMPNTISASIHDAGADNLHILGSARYCKEWIEILPTIYSNNLKDTENDQVSVLLFAEKPGVTVNGKFVPLLYEQRVLELVDYLRSNARIKLIVKAHPSMSLDDLPKYDRPRVTLVRSDNEAASFPLVKHVDIVIATVTSAIMDALVLEKAVVIPGYASPFKPLLHRYNNNIVVNSYEEFVARLENLITNSKKTCYSRWDRSLDELVGDSNVLERYANFITTLAKNSREINRARI